MPMIAVFSAFLDFKGKLHFLLEPLAVLQYRDLITRQPYPMEPRPLPQLSLQLLQPPSKKLFKKNIKLKSILVMLRFQQIIPCLICQCFGQYYRKEYYLRLGLHCFKRFSSGGMRSLAVVPPHSAEILNQRLNLGPEACKVYTCFPISFQVNHWDSTGLASSEGL